MTKMCYKMLKIGKTAVMMWSLVRNIEFMFCCFVVDLLATDDCFHACVWTLKFSIAKSLECYTGDAHSRNLYQKCAPMLVTKIVQFDWLAVFESFWYNKLAPNRGAFYSVQVSW